MALLPARVVRAAPDRMTLSCPACARPEIDVSGPFRRGLQSGEPVTLGLRPETFRLEAADPMLTVRVEITENLGGSTLVHATTSDHQALIMTATERLAVSPGTLMPLSFGGHPHVFDGEGMTLRP